MLSWIRAGWSIAGFPVRVAWKGYSALWWAFEDDAPQPSKAPRTPTTPGETTPGPAATPVVSGSSPGFVPCKPAKPTKALRRGFVATLATSAFGAWVMAIAAHQGDLSEPKAVLGGLWIASAACVASLLLVRRSERHRLAREAAPTPYNTVRRGLRHAVATVRERAAAAAFVTRAKAAQAAASAGLDRLVR